MVSEGSVEFRYAVIVTTYRRSGHLAEALRGIASQTLPPAAVIVADDGSGAPHRSANVAAATQYGFTYLELPHSGLPGLARDRALALVSEPWIALSDDDDVWDPEHIERLAACVGPGVVLVAGNARRSDTGLPYRPEMATSVDVIQTFPRNPIITSATLVNHDALIGIGGFTPFPRGAEDYAAWLRLATVGRTVVVNAPTIMYRITDDSLSAQASRARRPLPLICAADFLIWSAGKHCTMRRLPTRFWTLLVRPLLRWAARPQGNH